MLLSKLFYRTDFLGTKYPVLKGMQHVRNEASEIVNHGFIYGRSYCLYTFGRISWCKEMIDVLNYWQSSEFKNFSYFLWCKSPLLGVSDSNNSWSWGNGFSKVSYILYLFWMRRVILDFWHLYQKRSWGNLQNTNNLILLQTLEMFDYVLDKHSCTCSIFCQQTRGTTAFFYVRQATSRR